MDGQRALDAKATSDECSVDRCNLFCASVRLMPRCCPRVVGTVSSQALCEHLMLGAFDAPTSDTPDAWTRFSKPLHKPCPTKSI